MCCATFVNVFSEQRRITPDEQTALAAFVVSGEHASIPTANLIAAIHKGGCIGMQKMLTEFVEEQQWLIGSSYMRLLAIASLEFIDDLTEAVRAARLNGARKRASNARVYFDDKQCSLIIEGAPPLELTKREGQILKALLGARGAYCSPVQLARILSEGSQHVVQPHAVQQALSCLRSKLRVSHLSDGLIKCRRGVGYALVALGDRWTD